MKKHVLIASLIVILLFQAIKTWGQSSIADSISMISSNQERLEYIENYMNQYVYADPALSIEVAHMYDSIALSSGSIKEKAQSKNLLGMAYYASGQYDESFEYYIDAITQEEYLEDPKDRARLRNNLATCYQIRGDMEKSIEYFESALYLYESVNDSLWVANINGNLGLLYLNGKELQKAEPRIRKALDYYQKNNQTVYEGYTLLNLGNLLVEKQAYKESIPVYQKSIERIPNSINPLVPAAATSGIGVAYSRMNQFSNAEKYLQKGLELSQNIKHQEQIRVCHDELARLYEKSNKLKQALFHYKKYSTLQDSIFTLQQDEKMVEALTKYESEKKEQEIALLNSQNETAQARITGITRLVLFFGIGLLILSYLIYRLVQLNKRVKQSADEKDTLLREIHHRVKNNLQVISALLTLQSSYVKDDLAVEALREGQDRVQSMALIHKDLYQHDNLKGVNTKDYLEKLIDNLVESYRIDLDQIEVETDIESLWLDVDTMIPMGLMINELISNALKHAFTYQEEGTLKIALKEVEGMLKLKISDNGQGAPHIDKEDKKSFGYSLIHSFAKKLNADINYIHDNGLTIEMDIKEFIKAA